MGCISKIKGKNFFKEFNSIDEAKEWLRQNKNNIAIEEFATSKNGKKEYFLVTQTPHESVVKMVKANHQNSFEEIGNSIWKMDIDGFDTESYQKQSKALSLTELLRSLKVNDENGNEKRLFPDFINERYINTIYQSIIIQKLFHPDKEISDELIKKDRVLFFKDAPNDRLYSPKEWFDFLVKDHKDLTNKLNDEDFNNIETIGEYIQENNFYDILRGELGHKVFEAIIKNPTKSKDEIRAIVYSIFDEFYKKYDSKYDEVKNPTEIINRLKNIFDNTDLFDIYYQTMIEAKNNIESSFRRSNPNADITWFSETMVTADIDGTIDGKSQIRGKMDIIIVVDSVPHIIDLKFSRKQYSEWASAKKLKTDYQLASYIRMLNKVGLPTNNTTVQICNINFTNDGLSRPVIISRSSSIARSPYINKNLDDIFDKVVQVSTLNPEIFKDIEEKFNKLFGTSSVKGRKNATEDQTFRILSDRVKSTNGKYYVSYKIFNVKTGRYEYDTKKLSNDKSIRKEELQKLAAVIVANNNNSLSIQYDILVDDINGLLTNTIDIKDFVSAGGDVNMINFYSALFLKYKGSGARIIKSNLAKDNNVIFIQTDTGIDIISLTSNDLDVAYDQTNKNAALFSDLTNVQCPLKKTVGNVEIARGILIANELVKGTNQSINSVIAIQLGSPNGHFVRYNDMKFIAETSAALSGKDNNLNNRFINPLTYVLNNWIKWYKYISGDSSTSDSNPIQFKSLDKIRKLIDKDDAFTFEDIIKNGNLRSVSEFTDARKFNIGQNIAILQYLRDVLKANYPQLFSSIDKPIVTMETSLMNDIETAILRYQNNEVSEGDELKRFALSQSTYFNTLDTIPDPNAQIINRAIGDAFDKIATRHSKFTASNRAKIAQLKESKGFSSIRQLAIGDEAMIYDHLYQKNSDGSYDDLKLKNPWTDKSLSKEEREYIKFALFVLNKKKYKWSSIDDVDENVLTSNDYNVPLVRAQGLYQFRDANGKPSMLVLRSKLEEFKQMMVDAGDLFTEQIEERKKRSNEFEAFYNQFSIRTNADVRKEIIDRLGIKAFSTDLGTILSEYTIAEESQEVFDNETIPLIRSVLYVSQFNSIITGKDQEVFKEYIVKTTKNIIYNESVMSEEVQKYMKKFAPFRAAAFTIGLGFNIMNIPREILMGFFTNIQRAFTNSYGVNGFNFKDYSKAIAILTKDGADFIFNVTKIELLNEFYRMSNMSITEIPEQTTSNKTGVFASFTRWISWGLTAPDYFNRMSIFLSQMMHDGTWEAHTVETAEDGSRYLKYDIAKDKRFDIFVKYDGNIDLVPANLREKFNYQEALYESMLEEINKNSDNPYIYKKGTKPYLERAYTTRQRDSLKSFADTTFGYYDVETKALFFKTAIGQIFKQFMAYFAGKKVQYYQKGSNNTARGEFKQLMDINGNKIWRIIDDEGNVINKKDSELTDQERLIAKPVLAWTGTYIEGIIQSYWNLMKELGLWSWETVVQGKKTDRLARLRHDYTEKGNIRRSNFIQGLYDLLIGNFFMYLMNILFFDDPEISGKTYKEQYRDAGRFAEWLISTSDQATRDFDIINLINEGIFTWNSQSIGILDRVVTSFWKNLGDEDLSFAEGVTISTVQSVGFLKPLRPIVEDWKQDLKQA